MKLQGIFTPNIIPFHDDRRINEGELRRHIGWLIDKGVSGLYPNGSTGEFIRLDFEERKRVVGIVADEAAGRVPLLAGAAEANIDLVLEACAHCAAVSVTGPYYYKVRGFNHETHGVIMADFHEIPALALTCRWRWARISRHETRYLQGPAELEELRLSQTADSSGCPPDRLPRVWRSISRNTIPRWLSGHRSAT